jgi:hypothetical protein
MKQQVAAYHLGATTCEESDYIFLSVLKMRSTVQTIMTEQGFSEKGRKLRFEQWDKLGLDQVKSDLKIDPFSRIGSIAVQALAQEWARTKEGEQAARARDQAAEEKQTSLVTLKPTMYGVGIDLHELGRRFQQRFRRHKIKSP